MQYFAQDPLLKFVRNMAMNLSAQPLPSPLTQPVTKKGVHFKGQHWLPSRSCVQQVGDSLVEKLKYNYCNNRASGRRRLRIPRRPVLR